MIMRIARAAVLAAVCIAAAASAQNARNEVTLNLKEVDINTLIATVSEVTGRNFIIDPRVKAKVTVISSSPMSPESVYETFLSVLQVHGFAAVAAGEVTKIVPEANVRTDGGTGEGRANLPMDDVLTRVLQIQNVSAAQLVPILRPLVPQWGHLAAYAPSNILIISDRAANVERMERLIGQIDQQGDRDIEMIRLEHASAAEIVRILTTLSQQDKQQDPTTRPATIIADERSNSVLIGGDRSERLKYVDIIRSLDIKLPDDGATQVVYLRYASAENLAPILEGYAQQADQAAQGRAAGTPSPAGDAPRPVSTGGGSGGFVGSRILAEKDTNALVITAAPETMKQIRNVIEQLDIQRAQVMVETMIAEVGDNESGSLGVDWAVFNGERIAAAGILDPQTQQALAGLATSEDTPSPGAAAALLGTGLNLIGGRISETGTSFALLLKAIAGDGETNILSAPTLLTLDNEEAEFQVGQEVPFLTGQFTNTGANQGSINPFQTIDRKDVGLKIGITPQINEGNVVQLKIEIEVSSLAGGATGAVDLVTSKRTLTNTVTVEDGQVLVIGGLIENRTRDTQSKVPFLGDIPILGGLFRFQRVTREKANLMIFIRPLIMRKRLEADYYTQRKYQHLRDVQIRANDGQLPMIGGTHPALPPMEILEREGRLPEAPPPPVEDRPAGAADPG